MFPRVKALAALAVDNVAAHWLAYGAACAPLFLALTMWIAGTAVAEGLRRDGLAAIAGGPDILLSGRALGRQAPLESRAQQAVNTISGVVRVERRVLGAANAGPASIFIVGVEQERLASANERVRGTVPQTAGECLVGAELAREIGLEPGARLALEGALTRVFTVSGVLDPGDAIAGSKALVMAVEEAQALFGDERVSELCVWTLPGYGDAVARAMERAVVGSVAVTSSQTRIALEAAVNRRSGALSALLAPLLLFAAAAFCALSWFAHDRRGTEIAHYKLAGFSGGDLLLLSALENMIVAFILAAAALLCAWVWVRLCAAALLAPFLIGDLGWFPAQRIPALFLPLPAGLGFALAFTATHAGSILANWRLSLARAGRAFA